MQGGRVIYRSGMGIGGWRDGDTNYANYTNFVSPVMVVANDFA